MFAGAALLALGVAGVLPSGWAPAAQAADIMDKITAAKTPADHEEIAKWYDDQAKEAEDKAAEHKKMGQMYKKGGGPFAGKTHFYEHCEALVRNYTGEAKEYRALAAAHRAMAKNAK
jgi:hypothetical protein